MSKPAPIAEAAFVMLMAWLTGLAVFLTALILVIIGVNIVHHPVLLPLAAVTVVVPLAVGYPIVQRYLFP